MKAVLVPFIVVAVVLLVRAIWLDRPYRYKDATPPQRPLQRPPTPELRIELREEMSHHESWRVLRVHGEPRSDNCDPLEATLNREVSAAGCMVRVRFEDATSVDATVLGLLVSTYVRARRLGGRLRVVLPPRLRQLGAFRFFEDDDDGTAGAPTPLSPDPRPRQGGQAQHPDPSA